MATNSIFVCQECGGQYGKWVGQCKECRAWNSIVEEVVIASSPAGGKKHKFLTKQGILEGKLDDLSSSNGDKPLIRHKSGNDEFDRVLGGGGVPGSVILLCGEPGIGKSTLVLQLCNAYSQQGLACLYVSGEESASQIKMRAHRLSIDNPKVKLLTSTDLNQIAAAAESLRGPGLMVVDSIQTIFSETIASSPGTISQIKACTFELIKLAKQHGIIMIIIGHITKEGQIAGPKTLEHMVDASILFEGERTQQYRIVRAIKNRFGSTNEIGVFEMLGEGLSEVPNPSSIFLSNTQQRVSGSCIFAGIEGTRAIMVEIQALVVPSFLATPRRSALGWDSNRLAMLIAILNARLNLKLMDKEVYLNVVGGLKITETAADLAVAVALISAYANITLSNDTIFLGEIGLLGELRHVTQLENRLKEAEKLGFKKAVIPTNKKKIPGNYNLQVTEICDIKQLFTLLKENKTHA